VREEPSDLFFILQLVNFDLPLAHPFFQPQELKLEYYTIAVLNSYLDQLTGNECANEILSRVSHSC
jgi:hypothetical protein